MRNPAAAFLSDGSPSGKRSLENFLISPTNSLAAAASAGALVISSCSNRSGCR